MVPIPQCCRLQFHANSFSRLFTNPKGVPLVFIRAAQPTSTTDMDSEDEDSGDDQPLRPLRPFRPLRPSKPPYIQDPTNYSHVSYKAIMARALSAVGDCGKGSGISQV